MPNPNPSPINKELLLATMHSHSGSDSSHASSSSSSSIFMNTTTKSSNSNSGLVRNSQSSNDKDVISLPTRMVLSAVSGMGAAIVCHPLDVIRVQMQTSHFPSTWNAATTIYRTAGFQNGLYAGISAAFLRQWLYGSCRMGIYSYLLEKEQSKNLQRGVSKNDIAFATKLGMGCISGGIGSLAGTPSEVALVRMSADSKLPLADRRNYTGVFNCLSRIAKEEGVRMWWRGATPTVARATLLSSASLGVTSQAKAELIQSGYFGKDGQWAGGIPLLFCATLVSSFCANVVANPFDVIKSRLQNMAVPPTGQNHQRPMYNGMMDCFAKSIKAEGLSVLWAGFVPAFIKLAPYSVISLTLVDKLTKAVTGKDAF
ncbi:mitochondrial carrier protein [Nitzschia inconspicua]|uniref:Mitochondrial carrier protein n=1 Tax=Nitzschia inconspicua TaxID=303405 RepID=A0A9K3KKP1_9STRA|nr:mitochondrial carrier protein [Nitzschia inconspicua]